MDNRGRRAPERTIPLLALALAACASEPIDPSAESAFLQDRLIPHMVEWGKSKSEVLPLGPMLASQGFDTICTVAEYQSLSLIEKDISDIRSYRGSVGHMVPETRIAIVGIKGDTAHIGYLIYSMMGLRNEAPRCSDVQNTVLVRMRTAHSTRPNGIPQAMLKVAK